MCEKVKIMIIQSASRHDGIKGWGGLEVLSHLKSRTKPKDSLRLRKKPCQETNCEVKENAITLKIIKFEVNKRTETFLQEEALIFFPDAQIGQLVKRTCILLFINKINLH